MIHALSLLQKLSVKRIFCGTVILLLAMVAAQAQFKATVQGSVKDANGAAVPGVTITLTSKETNKSQQVQSSDEGFYRVSGLAPGIYSIIAEKQGFKKEVLEKVTVKGEETQGVDLTLSTGEVSESVTVAAEAGEQLQTENGNVSRAITTQEVRQLPQNGRDPYELVRLAPGVFGDGARGAGGASSNLPNTTGPGGSNNSIFQTENQVQIVANGQRLSDNNFTIDGVSVNSFNWGGAAIVTPNQEAVKEITVLSSTYSAEDGRNSGAQIKVVSQNGTNEFHGSAFLKYNSPKLNAFNKFGGPNGAQPVRVNDYIRQFGGSIGGPLLLPRFGEGGPSTIWGKNKSFFFFSYEGLRNNVTNTGTDWVETAQYRQLVQQLRPNSAIAKVLSAGGIQPRIINVLTPSCAAFGNDPTRCRVVAGGLDIGSPTGATGQYVSLGNPIGGGFDGIPDVQQVQFALPGTNVGNQYNARFDFTPNQKNSISVSTFITKLSDLSSDFASQGRPIGDLPFDPLNTSGTILFTHIFSPSLINEARFNASRFYVNQVAEVAAAGTNLGIPRVEVEGLPFDRIRFGAPQGEGTPAIFAQNTFEFSDTVTKTRGNHALKFGGVFRKEQDNSDLSAGGARPDYSFSGLWNLANGTPIFEGVNADPRTGAPATFHPYFRTNYYAGFAQDDWKFRPNLTLNLGLRYEYYSPLTEKFGRETNVFFTGQNLNTIQVQPVSQLSKPDRNNFAPRVGFAYTPRIEGFHNLLNHDRAVIRGGFGIAYNRIPAAPLNNVRGNPPLFARFGLCCGTATTDFGSPFAGGTILFATGSTNSIGSYPINPALGKGVLPSGAVVGAAVELWGTPQDLPNAYVYTYSLETQYQLAHNLIATVGYQGSAGHKLIRLVNQNFLFTNNPNFFQIFFSTPDVNSNYNALNLNLTRRFSKGLQMQANYRWSKSIDNLSYEGPGFVTNQTFPQNNHSERGPSDFDARHNFNLSAVYELPFFRGRRDFVGRALGGFQVSSIVTYHTGFPFTPVIGGCTSTPGGPAICPARPQGYKGPATLPTSNDAFISGIFGPNGASLFTTVRDANGNLLAPGIGRNSFRGPRYFDTDMSLVKQIPLSGLFHMSEAANLELKANFFNVFNQLNLAPFSFGSGSATITDPNFGKATAGLAGRVVELQARFRF
jgi:outer membrane receptor protein involved in Fe transport